MTEEVHPRESRSRSPTTVAQYRLIYRRLEKMAKTDVGLTWDAAQGPEQVARLFRKHEADWQAATARLYRAAIIYVFDQIESHGDVGIQKARRVLLTSNSSEETVSRLREQVREQRRDAKRRRPRTATQKVKRFSRKDTEELLKQLAGSRSTWGRPAARWFIAGYLTGLRPGEWQTARMHVDERGGFQLLVKNAKNTNDRAHSEHRTLSLTRLRDDQLRIIRLHLITVHTYASTGHFQDLYDACRQLVRRKADAIWPKRSRHPSLYTARHMFAADAKAMFDQVIVAALMGHASAETAGQHYAPAWSGRGGLGVEPSQKDINAVLHRNPGFRRRSSNSAEDTRVEEFVSRRTPGSR